MGQAYQIHNQHGLYFLTFQVVGWADIFSRVIYKDILIEAMDYRIKQDGLRVFAFVIMTNHMHVIWKSDCKPLSAIVRDFKRQTSKQILKEVSENPKESRKDWLRMIFRYHARSDKRSGFMQLWTHENHAVELVNNTMISQRLNYIHKIRFAPALL